MKLSTPNLRKIPTLSHQNHFKFGTCVGTQGGVPFSFREQESDRWFVEYGRSEFTPLSFRDECLRTARRIRENTNLPIDVLFSGGVDSEVALRSFLDAGIDVRVWSVRFKDGLNAHDTIWVSHVCESLGVKPRFVDLDILKFWENDGMAYAERTQCVSPQLLSTMWLADQTDGFCVLGSGENFIVKRVPKTYVTEVSPYLRSVWHLFEKEKIAGWYRHFLVQGRDAAPGFFQYTPEIMLSWFLDDLGCDLWNDRAFRKLSSASSKLNFYRRHFPVLERPKYTGFENVVERDRAFRMELRKRFDICDQIVISPVPTLVRGLLPSGSEDLAARYISEFARNEWGEELRLESLPAAETIDGRRYNTDQPPSETKPIISF